MRRHHYSNLSVNVPDDWTDITTVAFRGPKALPAVLMAPTGRRADVPEGYPNVVIRKERLPSLTAADLGAVAAEQMRLFDGLLAAKIVHQESVTLTVGGELLPAVVVEYLLAEGERNLRQLQVTLIHQDVVYNVVGTLGVAYEFAELRQLILALTESLEFVTT